MVVCSTEQALINVKVLITTATTFGKASKVVRHPLLNLHHPQIMLPPAPCQEGKLLPIPMILIIKVDTVPPDPMNLTALELVLLGEDGPKLLI